MKIRRGFVSNSSSSSFIIVGYGNRDIPDAIDDYYIGEQGELEFGWGPEIIQCFNARVNFACIQATYSPDSEDKMEMIVDCLKKNGVNVIGSVFTDIEPEKRPFFYIDHQSAYPENMEMFEDEGSLRRFLFCEDSAIHVQNDNG